MVKSRFSTSLVLSAGIRSSFCVQTEASVHECGPDLCQVLLSSVEGSEDSSITQDEIGQRIVTALKQVRRYLLTFFGTEFVFYYCTC